MTDAMTSFGLTKIVAPEVDKLLLEHGQELAKEHFNDSFIDGFIEGRCDLAILIPENLPRISSEGGSVVMAEFFTGVLEQFLEQVRDKVFPELEVVSNRSKIVDVSFDRKEEDVKDVVANIFNSGSIVYQQLEAFIKPKIKMGILHEDDSITYADIYGDNSSDKEFDFNDATAVKLVFYQDKYLKSLNALFFVNLNHTEHMRKFSPKPDPMS